jgi:hypothetical protein
MDTRLRQEGLYLCTGLTPFHSEPFSDPEGEILGKAGADEEDLIFSRLRRTDQHRAPMGQAFVF